MSALPKHEHLTLTLLLRHRAEQLGDALLYRFLGTGEVQGPSTELSFRQVDLAARVIAASVPASVPRGARAVLLYPPGLDFACAFFACAMRGLVAVPAYPPDPLRLARSLPRLRAIAADCQAAVILTTKMIAQMAGGLTAMAPELASLHWVATDGLDGEPLAPTEVAVGAPDELAFLQYTSGSTGSPKGVRVSHSQILHNERHIAQLFGARPDSVGVGWLPVYHDMGLIGNLLQPLYTGFSCTLMSPLDFLARPLRWLRAVSAYRGTISGGPNFAYDLCARKATEQDLAELELSSWDVAFNGAEPIRPATLEAFGRRFAGCGFSPRSFLPCYGLAEATLLVTGVAREAAPTTVEVALQEPAGDGRVVSSSLVSCGAAVFGQELQIVEPLTRRAVAEGQVGEIWVRGPNVASGYWGWSEADNAEVFAARVEGGASDHGYLRTGDLGLVRDGELVVTGRLKDLIIVNGRNYYPQDVEQLAERVCSRIRPGCCAAFCDSSGRVVVVAELEGAAEPDVLAAIEQQVRRAVLEEQELRLHEVVLIKPRTILKTSSGKLQRQPCRIAYERGELERLAPVSPVASAPIAVVDATAQLVSEVAEEVRAFIAAELGRAVAEVSVEATAAELGLDSLMMVAVQTAVEDQRGIRLPPMTFWLDSSARTLAHAVAAAAPSVAAPAIALADGGALPVSAGQARLWVLDRLAPGVATYHLLFGLEVEGELDRARLQQALVRSVERHDALRTRLASEEGVPVARLEAVALALELEDLSQAPRPQELLAQRASAFAAVPFELAQGPLVRAVLYRLAATRHVLAVVVHHAVFDGWSARLLASEVLAMYAGEAPRAAAPSFLEQVRREAAALPALETERAFWKEQLRALPALELPAARPRPATPSFRGAAHSFSLPASARRALQEVATREGVTPFVVLAAAYSMLLHRYSGSSDFGLGVVAANRADATAQRCVGFFANTLVLRCQPRGDQPARAYLRAIADRHREVMRHGGLPFSELVNLAEPRDRTDLTPLFRAALLFESAAVPAREAAGASWRPWSLCPDGAVPGTAKFDLTLAVAPREGELWASFEYATDLFDEPMIARMASHLLELLGALAAQPEAAVAALPMVTEREQRQLLEQGSCAPVWSASLPAVHRQFEAQVARAPEAPAVVFEDRALCYRELDARASALAARLAAAGVRPGDRVAVCMQRSLELMVGLLGVLKAGAAYVPLDPEYPADRLTYVMADSQVAAVVVHELTAYLLREHDVPVLSVGPDEPLPPAPLAPVATEADDDALMYLIYTSGSTGRPKGVRVPHRTVTAFFAAMDEHLDPAGHERGAWLALSSISFDISVLELFWPLTRGKTVVVQREITPTRAAARAGGGRPLELGLFYFAAGQRQRGGDSYRLLLEGAKFADRHNFSSVWVPERHFHDFGGLYPNPSVAAAAVAAVTERVALRAGSVVLPLHHPVRVAEEWAMVDNLSGGRVGLSVASGWHARDFVFAPERFSGRRDEMLSSLDVVRRLWRGEAVTLPSGTGAPVEVRLHPRPVQAELPFYLTAAGAVETFETAGRMGAGVLTHLLGQSVDDLGEKLRVYREARRAAGHDGPGMVTLMLHTFVAPDRDFVRAQVEQPFRDYLKSSSDLLRGFAANLGMGDGSRPFREDELEVLVDHAFQRYFKTSGLFGTPLDCREQLAQLQALGVTEIGCLIDFGVPTDTVLESLESLHALSLQQGSARQVSIPEQLERHDLRYLQCTPSLAQMLNLEDASAAVLARVPTLLLGGEALPVGLAQRLMAARGDAGAEGPLLNMYGPTETTIWSTVYRVRGDEASMPIGTPLGGERAYVLNEARQLCPVGVPGELYLAGAGVVLGYHQRPELDAERFVADPFAPAAEGSVPRMYRTGDRAVWREDGTLGFLGRNDDQVKLRGHRIELGEIEVVMERCPQVTRAVAHVWQAGDGDQRLVAYLLLAAGAEPSAVEAAVKHELAATLPAAMIPSGFVVVSELPYTPNGKIDRRALPAPEQQRAGAARELTPPRNDLERKVAAIWAEVLGLPAVGRDESFFDLGGHSLLLAKLHARLKAELGVEPPLVKLFQYPTVAKLVEFLESDGPGAEEQRAQEVRAQASLQRGALQRLAQLGKSRRAPRT